MVMVATAKLPPPSPHHLRLSWPGYAKIPKCLLMFHNSWNSEVSYGPNIKISTCIIVSILITIFAKT